MQVSLKLIERPSAEINFRLIQDRLYTVILNLIVIAIILIIELNNLCLLINIITS